MPFELNSLHTMICAISMKENADKIQSVEQEVDYENDNFGNETVG